ncbi:hypothetical protein OS493_030720 [Desmophyllum pertusum]|uniref:Uncharacterized protein n=1 Tax=Desmophyllum pertusum TaxID=174260 RepID=A0A9W9Z990_9CNID|nr:hypothetical protein OS493_030720 [Desmophyllum pertusum]
MAVEIQQQVTHSLRVKHLVSLQVSSARRQVLTMGQRKIVHNNVQVGKGWKIPAGTLGLGCHSLPTTAKHCTTTSNPPNITLGVFVPGHLIQSSLLGEKKLPADSCKQIHDASLVNSKPRAKNGIYWIKTDLQGSSSVQTYCDMTNGGWTLAGKISGKVGNIYKAWLVSNYNTAALKTPKITKQKEFACIDARSLAVEEASMILLSSAERTDGLGSKWVMWRLPGDRGKDSLWNHSVGVSAVKAAVQTPVMVYAWNGNKKICYQNKFGIMPYGHGGAYPYASYNTAGNTAKTTTVWLWESWLKAPLRMAGHRWQWLRQSEQRF